MNRQEQKHKRPNLLFILCDQQRYDCIGNSGIRPVKTPNIDKLAQNGARFTNAYTPIPVCAPARQSLFCGKRSEFFGALWNFGITHPVCEVPQDAYFFSRAIKNAGYNTAHFGKWNVSDKYPPESYGFDFSVTDDKINREINKKYSGINYPNGYFGDPCPIPLEDSHTYKLADKVKESLTELSKENKPWFINVDFSEPHLPCRPSAPFDTMYNPNEIEKWGGFDDTFINKPYIHKQQVINWRNENVPWETWARTVALYYGMISQYDDAIGKILCALNESGTEDDTLIIFTCDHGDMCGNHKMTDKHYVMYNDLLHVPFVMKYGREIKPQIFNGFIHNTLDCVPTILDFLGIEKPDNILHGDSLYKSLTAGEKWERDYAVSSYNGQQFGLFSSRAITVEGYKYVWNLTDIDELYDLITDENELSNRIYDDTYKEKLADLRQKLYHELHKCGDKMIEWTKDQLLSGRKI